MSSGQEQPGTVKRARTLSGKEARGSAFRLSGLEEFCPRFQTAGRRDTFQRGQLRELVRTLWRDEPYPDSSSD